MRAVADGLMKGTGWILIALGCIWIITGLIRVFFAAIDRNLPGVAIGLVTLGLAVIAAWGGEKLRAKAKKART